MASARSTALQPRFLTGYTTKLLLPHHSLLSLSSTPLYSPPLAAQVLDLLGGSLSTSETRSVPPAASLFSPSRLPELDVANAFDSFNRVSMFEALRRSPFSNLIPFFRLFYSTPSPLHYRSGPLLHTFQSAFGLRQSDPCGPFLYALTQQFAIQPTQQQSPSIFIRSYVDDTYLVGPPSDIFAAYTDLTARLLSLGLTVQPSKCSLWAPMDLPEHCILPSAISIAANGLTVAGVPTSSNGYITSTVREKLDSFTSSLPCLHRPQDLQIASRILSLCINARPSFFLRIVTHFFEIQELPSS
ncbi:unnamed protein product [Closterium sp. NIES-53]